MIDDELRIEYRGRDAYIVSKCPECGAKAEAAIPSGRHATLPTTLDCYEWDDWGEPVVEIRQQRDLL
ncbi:hypothetical protein M0R89_11600 [Halorussus limi]|uniref:Uncharacterized protein n=1 Tax=Halorussus limi TaxID=2938695 RepID=A0A8U0HQ60_9EURY|nr:hypothetical protein [Halorussus limi]UPV73192.1 hypothetical protein M0R89_11600 [Halorussus limi]